MLQSELSTIVQMQDQKSKIDQYKALLTRLLQQQAVPDLQAFVEHRAPFRDLRALFSK